MGRLSEGVFFGKHPPIFYSTIQVNFIIYTFHLTNVRRYQSTIWGVFWGYSLPKMFFINVFVHTKTYSIDTNLSS